jgi:DNA-binding NtrC family response regulator
VGDRGNFSVYRCGNVDENESHKYSVANLQLATGNFREENRSQHMHHGRIWMVAAEHEETDLADKIASLLQGPVARVAFGHWKRRELPSGTPELILFDLRDEGSWAQAAEWATQNRCTELISVPWIGITADCVPLQVAIDADKSFSAFIRWPFQAEEFERVARMARKRLVTRGYTRGSENRFIAGSTRRFRTFEPALFPVLENLEVAALADFTILLIAETGTGKTTLAQIIHENSPRRDSRFITVACASLPRELIESELFGHVKGAFTGADRNKEGKFDAARGGTILLDEIDALEPAQQAKLLRVLETGEYEPVGSNETRKTTARCIVASNVCLEKLVREGRFRQDLFYRLHQLKFEIPPLRQRPRDIVPLAVEIIEEVAREGNLRIRGLDPALVDALLSYHWPGNIRELRNELRRCALFARDGIVRTNSLSESINQAVAKACSQANEFEVRSALAGSIALSEQQAIENMLRSQNNNRAATARALGISRVTLYNKLRRYGIGGAKPDKE